MRYPSLPSCLLLFTAFAATPSLRAQWVTFNNETSSRLSASAALVENDPQEKDYAWADLDQDGDIDLVIVRKEPVTSSGRFANVLLMNEGGVLTDRSSTLTQSTVPGSTAFLDATNDRDVVIADVNGDGWADVVTCTTLTAGQPQYIRVPRVYINLGNSGGTWQGLLYDDALRIDDSGWGNQGEHRFCSVAAGDVDGDGDLDLYFGDYQQGGPRSVDVEDRLLINDGTGYFTDESAARMTTEMLESSFGMKVDIVDMNNDGKLDIIKDDALNAPQGISISLNDTATEGVFGTYQIAYANAPYHFNIGDLNNDNLPDMIVSDDGQDRYILNQTTTPGQSPVPFSPTIAFTYSGGGSDDGFGGNNLIVDLDNDGWNDAIIADVDVDISGCNRRCHIFRNLGNAPNVTLQEQMIAGQVVGGITPAALQGTYDVAVFDIDGDGFKDMVVGRCTGTEVYINAPPTGISFDYVGGQPTMIPPGAVQDVTVDIVGSGGISALPGTGELHYSINGAAFQVASMSDNGSGRYTANLPAMNCADSFRYYVSVQASNSQGYSDPPAAPAGFYEGLAAFADEVIYENDFENQATGWTVVNDPALGNGAWERAQPNGTINQGKIAAPFTDAQSGSAVQCFITKQGNLAEPAGLNDVDGGPTDLISPVLDYAGTDGTISFQAWVYSSVNGSDPLEVQLTGDGSSWVTALSISPSTAIGSATNTWTQYSFKVGDHITPTATTQVRFRIADLGSAQIVECGIDVFQAKQFECDYCQPEQPLQTVGSATLSMCGGDLSPGTSTTLEVEGMPSLTTGLLLFDVFPNPTAWNGGELVSPAPVVVGQIFANTAGDFTAPLPIGGILPPGFALYVQAVYSDAAQPFQVGITNALQVTWN